MIDGEYNILVSDPDFEYEEDSFSMTIDGQAEQVNSELRRFNRFEVEL